MYLNTSLRKKKCDLAYLGRDKVTPIYLASMNGHLDAVKYLALEKYGDPMCRTSDNMTPLHIAALNGHMEVIRFLMDELNCDPSVQG